MPYRAGRSFQGCKRQLSRLSVQVQARSSLFRFSTQGNQPLSLSLFSSCSTDCGRELSFSSPSTYKCLRPISLLCRSWLIPHDKGLSFVSHLTSPHLISIFSSFVPPSTISIILCLCRLDVHCKVQLLSLQQDSPRLSTHSLTTTHQESLLCGKTIHTTITALSQGLSRRQRPGDISPQQQ